MRILPFQVRTGCSQGVVFLVSWLEVASGALVCWLEVQQQHRDPPQTPRTMIVHMPRVGTRPLCRAVCASPACCGSVALGPLMGMAGTAAGQCLAQIACQRCMGGLPLRGTRWRLAPLCGHRRPGLLKYHPRRIVTKVQEGGQIWAARSTNISSGLGRPALCGPLKESLSCCQWTCLAEACRHPVVIICPVPCITSQPILLLWHHVECDQVSITYLDPGWH
jgi:hypothetical protein